MMRRWLAILALAALSACATPRAGERPAAPADPLGDTQALVPLSWVMSPVAARAAAAGSSSMAAAARRARANARGCTRSDR